MLELTGPSHDKPLPHRVHQFPPATVRTGQALRGLRGGPVYEEIILDEIKDIPLTGNAAYALDAHNIEP